MTIPAQANQGSMVFVVMASVLLLVLLLCLVVFVRFFSLWLQAFLTRAQISLPNLIAMSLRKVDPQVIVQSKIMAVQSGVAHDQDIRTSHLEAHYLAGGNVPRVIEALVAARSRGAKLTFHEAAAIDLSGRDVMQAVAMGEISDQVLVAESVIHPAGSVVVDGESRSAVSAADAIVAGQQVEVVEAQGDILVVRPTQAR